MARAMAMRWRWPPLRRVPRSPITVSYSCGNSHDEIVGQGGLGGGDDAFFGNIREPVTDVVPHRVVEQNIFLRDHGDLFAQGTDGDVANVHAVDANGAGSQLVKPRKQIDERGFSGAARADKSDHFAFARRAGGYSRRTRRDRLS